MHIVQGRKTSSSPFPTSSSSSVLLPFHLLFVRPLFRVVLLLSLFLLSALLLSFVCSYFFTRLRRGLPPNKKLHINLCNNQTSEYINKEFYDTMVNT